MAKKKVKATRPVKATSRGTASQKIIRLTTSTVQSHPQNPRKHDENNLQMIMKSYSEFGELGPLVVWGRNNYVIAGNGRLEAAKRLGMKEVNVIRADHLTDEQALAFLVMDNKTTDSSRWDDEQLAELIGDLQERGADLSSTGLSQLEIEPLMRAGAPDEFSEFDENVNTQHKCPKCGYEWSGKVQA